MLIGGQRCLDTLSNQFGTLQSCQWSENSVFCGQLLICHIFGCSLTHNIVFVVTFHFEHSVIALGQYETVGLAIHCLRTKSSSNQEHVLVLLFAYTFRVVKELQLDASVFLRANTLILLPRSVVIRNWLAILNAVDGISFTELDFAFLFEVVELPANEGIIVWITLGGYE